MFIGHERRIAEPLIDLEILRRPALSVGLSSGLVSYLVLFGTLFVVPYFLSAEHVDAALIGLQLAVLPVAIGIMAPIAGRLLSRVGARSLTAGGLLLTGAGLLEIALRHGTIGLLVGLAVAGLGLGAFTPANNATIMSASPKGHAGVIGGVLNMTRGVGTALGVALTSALYITGSDAGSASASPAAAANGLTVALAALGVTAAAVGLALLLAPEATRVDTGEPSGEKPRGAPAAGHKPPHGLRASASSTPALPTSPREVSS